MCFVLNYDSQIVIPNACRLVAKEDIRVFKIVYKMQDEDVFKSLYQDYPYSRGETYKTELKVSGGEINEGFHSYSNDGVILSKRDRVLLIMPTSVKGGYDFIDYVPINKYKVKYRMDCVIPSGSVYYQNKYGEVVSDSITVVGFKEI